MRLITLSFVGIILVLMSSLVLAASDAPEAQIVHAPALVRDCATRLGLEHIAPIMEGPKGKLYVKVLKRLNVAGNSVDILRSLAKQDYPGASETAVLWIVGDTGPVGAGLVTTYLVVAVGAETVEAALRGLEEWTKRVFPDQVCFSQATRAEHYGVKAYEAYTSKDNRALAEAQKGIIRATMLCPFWWRDGYNVGYLMDSDKILQALSLSLKEEKNACAKAQELVDIISDVIKSKASSHEWDPKVFNEVTVQLDRLTGDWRAKESDSSLDPYAAPNKHANDIAYFVHSWAVKRLVLELAKDGQVGSEVREAEKSVRQLCPNLRLP